MIKEAAIETLEQAKLAVAAGANRLEVCADLTSYDGLTPKEELFTECQKLGVPCVAMIRPRPGDFVLRPGELEQMGEQIERFVSLGAQGVVVGVLTKEACVDVETIKPLVERAKGAAVTFHKAIDVTVDILQACHDLLLTGVNRVLTSGGQRYASEAVATIRAMQNILAPKVKVVVGGGVTFQNLDGLAQQLPGCEFHGRKIVEF